MKHQFFTKLKCNKGFIRLTDMTDFLYSLYLAWKTNNSNTCTCQKVVRSSLVGTVPHSHSLCLHSLCDHIYNTFVLRLTRGVPHAISFKVKKIDNKIFNLYFDFFCYVFYRWYAERQLFVWLEFASIRQRKKKRETELKKWVYGKLKDFHGCFCLLFNCRNSLSENVSVTNKCLSLVANLIQCK